MKKVALGLILMVLGLNNFAQIPEILVFTKKAEANFRLYADGDQKNNFYVDSMSVTPDSLVFDLTLSFENPDFADISETISLVEGQDRQFEVVSKSGFVRWFSKMGRAVGKKLKIGTHEDNEVLQDVFLLKDVSKYDHFN